MLIGISGKIGSGKDTVGKYLQYLYSKEYPHHTFEEFQKYPRWVNNNDWQIKKYADKLKEIVCLLIGCTREQLEDINFKNKELGQEWWYYIDPVDMLTMRSYLEWKDAFEDRFLVKLTPRLLLQYLGTECAREIIHPNTWVNALFADYKPIYPIIESSNTFTDNRYKHGYNKTRIFRIYHNIKQRCYNPKHPRYNNYGERGIVMCKEWENSIEDFIKWSFNNGYKEDLTIDRINNNLGYYPENCRWVSYATQSINTTTRSDNTSGFKGVSKDKYKWRADIQINGKKKFLGYFDTAEEASEVYEEHFLQRNNLYSEQEKTSLIYPNWCITDVRFPNEADAIKALGGKLIRLTRTTNVSEEIAMHPSETALDNYNKFDFIIENKGTEEELYTILREITSKLISS